MSRIENLYELTGHRPAPSGGITSRQVTEFILDARKTAESKNSGAEKQAMEQGADFVPGISKASLGSGTDPGSNWKPFEEQSLWEKVTGTLGQIPKSLASGSIANSMDTVLTDVIGPMVDPTEDIRAIEQCVSDGCGFIETMGVIAGMAGRRVEGVADGAKGLKRLADSATETVNPRELISRQGRDEMTPKNIRKMKKEMDQTGYEKFDKIDVYDVDGELIIKDGHHRTRAAIYSNNVDEVPIDRIEVTNEATKKVLRDQAFDAKFK